MKVTLKGIIKQDYELTYLCTQCGRETVLSEMTYPEYADQIKRIIYDKDTGTPTSMCTDCCESKILRDRAIREVLRTNPHPTESEVTTVMNAIKAKRQ